MLRCSIIIERDTAYRLLRQSAAQGFPEAENSVSAMLTMDCDQLSRVLERALRQRPGDGTVGDDEFLQQPIDCTDDDRKRLSNMISYSHWRHVQPPPAASAVDATGLVLIDDAVPYAPSDDEKAMEVKWAQAFEATPMTDAELDEDDSSASDSAALPLTDTSRRATIAGHRVMPAAAMSCVTLRYWIMKLRHEVNALLERSAISGDSGALYEIGASYWYADRFGYTTRDPSLGRSYVSWAAIAGDKQAPELLREIDAQLARLANDDDDGDDNGGEGDDEGDGDGDSDADMEGDDDVGDGD